MKKKLVAFAVTAAMVVTSAVPAFAQTWGKPADPVQVGNVITIKESTPRTDMAGPITESGINFETVIDLNKDLGGAAKFTLNFTDKDGKPVAGPTLWAERVGGSMYPSLYFSLDDKPTFQGIVTLQWKVSTAGIEVAVVQNGYDEDVIYTLKAALPQGAVALTDLTVTPGSNPVVMYEVAPEYITDVEVVKANSSYQAVNEKGEVLKDGEKPVIVTQPVKGDYYLVNSITFNDGTVITGDEIEKYASLEWKAVKADGTVVWTETTNKNKTGRQFYVDADNYYDGCAISLEVKGHNGSGLFGTVIWGQNADPIAIVDRMAGANRYETAYAVADRLKSTYAKNGKFGAIVVANGDSYCDALSGTALATAKDAPIILVNGGNEDAAVEYIQKNMLYSGTVYILGGENVVSDDFAKAVGKYNVKRLGGDDRYATNVAILKELGVGTKAQVIAVSGTNFADALSAAATNIPVMLVGDELTNAQKKMLGEIGYKETFVVGGTNAVASRVAEQVALYGDSDRVAERIAGSDRYETSTKVAGRFFGNAKNVILATGTDFADALTGGVYAAENTMPVILVNEGNTDKANEYVVRTGDNANLTVIGGLNAVSNAVIQAVVAEKIA